MTAELNLHLFDSTSLTPYISLRAGEKKVGEQLVTLPPAFTNSHLPETLEEKHAEGIRFCIILIPEDIGPRANLGRGGADRAPEAFLKYFCNLQANRFLDLSSTLLLGEIGVADLMKQSREAAPDELRALVAELDERVAPVLDIIASSGMEPIVIGGGNNNSYPIIKGITRAAGGQRASVINLDPHADFRPLEGRHSGNPFSCAHKERLLSDYFVLGLHESYNSEEMLARLEGAGYGYASFDDASVRRTESFEQQIETTIGRFAGATGPIGIELDLDSIIDMPSSAKTPVGITVEQALSYIHAAASSLPASYLHLSEAAPEWAGHDGERQAGKALALCVATYIKARKAGKARKARSSCDSL